MKVYKFILSALLTGLLCSCQKDVIKYNIPSETFEIEFDSNGGSQIDTQIVTYGSTVIKPSNPIKKGYTFKAWYYRDSNGAWIEYPFSLAVTNSITLKAEYTANTYTINFEKNDDNNNEFSKMISLICYYDTEQKLPANIYKITGKAFLGWALSKTNAENLKIDFNDEAIVKNLTEKNDDSINLYAVWNTKSYHSITYVLNGGKNSSDNVIKFLENQNIVLYDAQKTDCEFDGWYDNPNFEGKKIIGWSSGEYTSDLILYAKWKSTEYTLTINDRGTTSLYSMQYDSVIKDYEIPEVQGGSFGGFYTEPYGKGEQYINSYGKALRNFDVKKDLDLYAFWTFKILYDISYIDSKNGFNNNPSSYTGEKDIVLNDMQCREGYVFEGWLDEYEDAITVIPQGSYGQRTIKCKGINPIKYTITYVLNGGAWDSSAADGMYEPPDFYVIGDVICLPCENDIKKSGYTFAGWFLASDFSGEAVSLVRGTAESYGDLKFYAKWE